MPEKVLSKMIDPYYISLIVFIFVSLNVCVELNSSIMTNYLSDVTRNKLTFVYGSSPLSYAFKVVRSIFTLFLLLTILVVLLIGTLNIIKGSPNTTIMGMVSTYMKKMYFYMFTFCGEKQSIITFLVIFPFIMLFTSLAYALSLYKPTTTFTDESELSKVSLILETNHHYLYFIFICSLMGVILYLIIHKIINKT